MLTTGRDLSLYFHVPFCKKKCPYCHFYSIGYSKDLIKNYLEAVLLEIEKKKELFENRNIVSIYFGGGTPSLLDKDIQIILEALEISNDIEITIETNPEDVSIDKIKVFKNLGINRISIGVQSFDDKLLQALNRTHCAKKALLAIDDIYTAGIENISIDLMYDIPYQTTKSWLETLNTLKNIPIKHISLYNLVFEENTYFFQKQDLIKQTIPSDEMSLELYSLAIEKMKQFNFNRYEISAFAKDGLISKHNIGYWNAREFLGFGPSAFSYFEKRRWKNISNLNKYHQALKNNDNFIAYEEKLNYPNDLKELLAIRLRVLDGLDIIEFQNEFGYLPFETLDILNNSDLIIRNKDHYKLSEKGLLFYDELASEII